MVRLDVAPELRFLLPARWHGGVVEVAADETASLGHVVQSVGVPLTEVGALRVGGRMVPPGRRAGPDELVEVGRREPGRRTPL
jgi:hydrogenase maturation factor HypE